ncbi:HK97-gp10 family putative phage morphogenesis protein [Streptococcus thermophilus]|uniref:HK97-gp10 family putative phage morphogenesis protein n=1 Tax=Streptococcus thermophilus TaxID=1308 RepID=UPI003A7F68A4
MATLTFYGLDEMSQSLLKNASSERRSKVLRKHGSKLKEAAVKRAQFNKGYSTGATRRSITLQVQSDKAIVEALTSYSGYLEVGTRKMEAQPFMKPALEEVVPKMVEELAKWE